jgi:hypothetical protein
VREVGEALWLEALYQQRRELSPYQHMQIPQGETRAEFLELVLRNPTYPFIAGRPRQKESDDGTTSEQDA